MLTHCRELQAQIEAAEDLLEAAESDRRNALGIKSTIDLYQEAWGVIAEAQGVEVDALSAALEQMTDVREETISCHQHKDLHLLVQHLGMYNRLHHLLLDRTEKAGWTPAQREPIVYMQRILKDLKYEKYKDLASTARRVVGAAIQDKISPQDVTAATHKGAYMCHGALTNVGCHQNAHCTMCLL